MIRKMFKSFILHSILSFRRRRNLRNTIRQRDFFLLELRSYLRRFLLRRNDKFGDGWGLKKAKYLTLAPIAVEILVSRGSARKIAMDSGTNADKNALFFLLQNQLIELLFFSKK
jgi:hypothetical protein